MYTKVDLCNEGPGQEFTGHTISISGHFCVNDNHDGIVQVFMQYKHQKKGLKADVNPTLSFDGFGGCSLNIADLSVSEYYDEIDAIKHGFQYKKHPKFK